MFEWWPGGLEAQGGEGGRRAVLNVPLKEGCSDETFIPLFERTLREAAGVFRPEAIVLQCGPAPPSRVKNSYQPPTLKDYYKPPILKDYYQPPLPVKDYYPPPLPVKGSYQPPLPTSDLWVGGVCGSWTVGIHVTWGVGVFIFDQETVRARSFA